MREWVDARKVRIGKKELAGVFEGARSVTVAKGKKIATLDLSTASDSARAEAVLGPTGNLRAPTLRRGGQLFVGFHEEGLAQFLR